MPGGVNTDELPRGWAWATVRDIALKVGSGATPTGGEANYKETGVPLIRSMNVHFEGFREEGLAYLDDTQAADLANVEVCARDVLLNITGASIGRVTIAPEHLDGARVNQHVCIIRPIESVDPSFLRWFLACPRQQSVIFRVEVGATRQALTKEMILNFEVPIAPLAEQRRIVAKVEELFSDLDAGVAALERVRAGLKRYRASVLRAAVEGRLTADWRAANPISSAFSQSTTALESPTHKKRAGRLWGAGHVPELRLDELGRTPQEWKWVQVRDLGPNPEEVVQVGPMSMKSSEFAENGVPVLNVGCVQWGRFDEHKLDHLPHSLAARFQRYRVKAGDVLFTRSGTVGRCSVVLPHQNDWLMTFHLLRVRTNPTVCKSQYLQLVFEGAPHIRRQTREASIGTTRAGFNTNLLANLSLCLPPLAEQEQIVAAVEERLSIAAATTRQVEADLARAARLRQAILKRAFAGKLVPQDPSDEPASALLERIRTCRAQAPPPKRAKTPRKQAATDEGRP